jgi:hypothetical protein
MKAQILKLYGRTSVYFFILGLVNGSAQFKKEILAATMLLKLTTVLSFISRKFLVLPKCNSSFSEGKNYGFLTIFYLY